MVLRTTAHYAAAQAEFEQAAAVYQQHGDLEGLARTTAQSGWIHSLSGTSSAGISRLQATLDRVSVPTTPAASLAELCVALAVLYDDTGQYGAALAAAEQAAEFARAAHATQLLGQAQRLRGAVLCVRGRLEDGRTLLQEAIALLDTAGDLRGLSMALNHLAWGCQ